MQPSAYDLTRQAKWEIEASRRAEARYRQAAEKTDIAALPAGQAMLRRVVPPLLKLIQDAQAEAAVAVGAAGRTSGWCWPMQLLSADRLAFIACAVALRVNAENAAGTLANLSDALARCVRDELEYHAWTAQQAKANKDAKAAGDTEHKDLLGALKRTYPDVDRKTWARWRKKVDALRSEPWDKAETVYQFGSKMVELMCQAAPDVWALVHKPVGRGHTQLTLELTEEALSVMKSVDERAAVSRPLRMPMLCRPRKWEYSEATPLSTEGEAI